MLGLIVARALLQATQLWQVCGHRRTGESTAGIAVLECGVDGVREGRRQVKVLTSYTSRAVGTASTPVESREPGAAPYRCISPDA